MRVLILMTGLTLACGGVGLGADCSSMESAGSAAAQLVPDSRFVAALVDHELLNGIEDVHLDQDYAYLPCREGLRLTICNVADPGHPRIVSTFIHPELAEATGLAQNGDWLYVTSFQSKGGVVDPRLLVLDARDKTAVRYVSSLKLGGPGYVYKVCYRDGLCYVAHQSDKKLHVVDVRHPEHPVVVSSLAITSENDGPFSLLLNDQRALVGTLFGDRNRLAVVDISDPQHPAMLQTLTAPDFCTLIGTVAGDCYYTAGYSRNSMIVFDISRPDRIEVRGRLQDRRLGKPNRCLAVGNRAYLPMVEGHGIAVVDITDPAHPRFVTAFSDPLFRKTYGIAARGDLLYVGSREGDSLVILDRHSLEQ